MVRQCCQGRANSCARAALPRVRIATARAAIAQPRSLKRERDERICPSLHARCHARITRSVRRKMLRVATLAFGAPPRDKIHEPRLRNQEQWREKKAEKRVQPDERDVKCAKGNPDPKNAERTVRVHKNLPLRRSAEDRDGKSDGKVPTPDFSVMPNAMTVPSSDIGALVANALSRGERAVLAVSGGLDSMTLLHAASNACRDRECDLTVATFDHRSGPYSGRAASLVVEAALSRGLQIVVGYAEESMLSEAAWRAARWEFLRSVAARCDALILTAHTGDDQIETVLMRA